MRYTYTTLSKEEVQSERSGKQADLSAAASGFGGYCPEGIPVETAIFGILGAFGVAFGVLYRAVTIKTGGRRKRRDTKDEVVSPLDKISDFFWMGLEEFEDKVDKIANGQDDDSWIGQIYNTFSNNFGIDGSKVNDSELGPQEGLEPPILDETWGLEDISKLHESEDEELPLEPRSRSKRSDPDENNNENEIMENTVEVIDDPIIQMLSGETKCKARFWKCLAQVAQSSLHYMNEPGGVSGAVQKMMFRVAFHGGIGNFWKALMTIPEARQVKHCMNKQDDCMSFEVLRKEVQTFDGKDFVSGADEKRLLINPEFVESMDTSDGSEQFTPEDQKIEDEFAKSDNQ